MSAERPRGKHCCWERLYSDASGKFLRHVSAYVEQRRKQDASDATINRELEHLRTAFRLAVDSELLPKAPKIRMLEEDNVRNGFIDQRDIRDAGRLAEKYLRGEPTDGLADENGDIGVTNSVTNPMGNRGQCRATVTNFVTKLRAIQGNEITTFGESRAMEGN